MKAFENSSSQKNLKESGNVLVIALNRVDEQTANGLINCSQLFGLPNHLLAMAHFASLPGPRLNAIATSFVKRLSSFYVCFQHIICHFCKGDCRLFLGILPSS